MKKVKKKLILNKQIIHNLNQINGGGIGTINPNTIVSRCQVCESDICGSNGPTPINTRTPLLCISYSC